MKFLTDIKTDISNFCLLHIDRYNDKRKQNKKLCFIDPGVYNLKKNIEYPQFELLHYLAAGNLLPNEYISIDYPSDMNPEFEDYFVQETIRNNLRYADNPQYINTLQYKFCIFNSFVANFNHLKPLFWNKNKIVGFGNLCRILYPNEYTDKVFAFIRENMSGIKQIHFYGLGLRVVKKYFPMFSSNQLQKISLDNTKWTKAVVNDLKFKFGLNCNRKTRNLYFWRYMKEIDLALKWKDFVNF
jgi:hypothetical protein